MYSVLSFIGLLYLICMLIVILGYNHSVKVFVTKDASQGATELEKKRTTKKVFFHWGVLLDAGPSQ